MPLSFKRPLPSRLRAFILTALGAVALMSGCAGDVLFGEHALNYPDGVTLRQAERRPFHIGDEQLEVNYLRAGGVLFRWHGEAVMTAPFFSNYPLHLLPGHRIIPNQRAIEMGLGDPGLKLEKVQAILVGHSHYDHIGDLPEIAFRNATNARLYVNRSGANMLAAYPLLRSRVKVLDDLEPKWTWISPRIRMLAIESEHAPNAKLGGLPLHWAPGHVKREWDRTWEHHYLHEQREGTTYAFVIDFMDPEGPERVAFRVHYQDAASRPNRGYLPPSVFGPSRDERDVDLAVLCMPGRETLPTDIDLYPTGILKNTRAHHALVIHYEDFFLPIQTLGEWSGVHLLPTLAGSRATDFLGAIFEAIADPRPGPCAHPERVQGLCSKAYTVPLPGEWLAFDTEPSMPILASGEAVLD
jgi:hypothetical protein